MKTRDFKTFTDVTSEMTFPLGLKHGTAFIGHAARTWIISYKVSTQQVTNVRPVRLEVVSQREIEKRLAEIDAVAKRGPFKPDVGFHYE
ncbi:MAG: hypothetical protein QM813_24340 [Verrucomicrobiota bacterium]